MILPDNGDMDHGEFAIIILPDNGSEPRETCAPTARMGPTVTVLPPTLATRLVKTMTSIRPATLNLRSV